MEIINVFRVGILPSQPLFQEDIIIIIKTERNQLSFEGNKEKRL